GTVALTASEGDGEQAREQGAPTDHYVFPSGFAEQPAEAGNGLADSGQPQGLPEAGLVAADHGLAQITLEYVEHGDGGKPGAAQQHGVGAARIRAAREQIGALLVLGVDVPHVFQAMVADNVEAG